MQANSQKSQIVWDVLGWVRLHNPHWSDQITYYSHNELVSLKRSWPRCSVERSSSQREKHTWKIGCCLSSSQESEWAESVTAGVSPPLSGHGERSDPGGAQGRVEGEGAEAAGGHQDAAREAAAAGEKTLICSSTRSLFFFPCLILSSFCLHKTFPPKTYYWFRRG